MFSFASSKNKAAANIIGPAKTSPNKMAVATPDALPASYCCAKISGALLVGIMPYKKAKFWSVTCKDAERLRLTKTPARAYVAYAQMKTFMNTKSIGHRDRLKVRRFVPVMNSAHMPNGEVTSVTKFESGLGRWSFMPSSTSVKPNTSLYTKPKMLIAMTGLKRMSWTTFRTCAKHDGGSAPSLSCWSCACKLLPMAKRTKVSGT
mmetsp:Transcript_88933/g.272388  ORF Transcript_88933/g.272388 Transcript_88933/m.272388 type:complete len:205 (+) Transcript_88933:1144-1758(+)